MNWAEVVAWGVVVWVGISGLVMLYLWLLRDDDAIADDLLPAPIILGCLDCRGELERWEQWFRCTRCGIYYNPDLLAETPARIWYAIQEGRMICRECEPALPDMPRVHIDTAGNPIPCPIHGPAPERER